MDNRPAWFVAAILCMLGVLMISHLAMLWVGVRECDDYASVLIERAAKDPSYKVSADNQECNNVEADFSDAVAKYLAVFLSLLGGAAVYGAASRTDEKGRSS